MYNINNINPSIPVSQFSQCLNRQKTLNEYCHPKVQKETSNSTEIACQNR